VGGEEVAGGERGSKGGLPTADLEAKGASFDSDLSGKDLSLSDVPSQKERATTRSSREKWIWWSVWHEF
jgi:hypothetical protein